MALAPTRLRQRWLHAQGLLAPVPSPPAALLARTGWSRTVGGADGYLSMLARSPGLTVAQVSAAIDNDDIQVVPAARGCIYVVPTAHVPLALDLAKRLTLTRTARDMKKLGVAPQELDRVAEAIVDVLKDGPATTRQVGSRLPEGLARDLGALGRKTGVTSTLPPALRQLEFQGRIRRRLIDARLDHERYTWTLHATPAPPPNADVALARLFLQWFGPTTAGAMAAFMGLTKTACLKALRATGAPERDDEVLGRQTFGDLDAADLGELNPVMLPGMDGLLTWHSPARFVAPEDEDREISVWGRQKVKTWGGVKHALTRSVLIDGVVAGEWEWDPDTEDVIVGGYHNALPDAVHETAQDYARLLRELGHGRAFLLEKDDHLRTRAARVRALRR